MFTVCFHGPSCFHSTIVILNNTLPGLIGAGTNNARLAGLLRGLSSYYYKEPTALFLVRVAQGLVHMGKGLLTMAPQHSDAQLISGRICHTSRATLVFVASDFCLVPSYRAYYDPWSI